MSDLTNVIMNQKEIIQISLENLAKMFHRRKYIKNDNFDDKIIDEIIKNNMHNFELDGKKLSINFINTDLKNISSGSALDDYLSKNLNYHKVIISKSFNKKVYKQIMDNYKNSEIFSFHVFLEDIIQKDFIPEHQLLNEEQKKELGSTFNLNDLSKIYDTDMMVRYYGAKINDVFRIIRPSLTSGNSICYRIVIPGNLDNLFIK